MAPAPLRSASLALRRLSFSDLLLRLLGFQLISALACQDDWPFFSCWFPRGWQACLADKPAKAGGEVGIEQRLQSTLLIRLLEINGLRH